MEDTWWPVERREGEERNTYIIHTEIRRPPSESTYRNMLNTVQCDYIAIEPGPSIHSRWVLPPPSAPRLSFFVSLEERRLFLIHLSLRPLRRHRRRRLVGRRVNISAAADATRHSLTLLPRSFFTAAFYAMVFLLPAVSILLREVCIQNLFRNVRSSHGIALAPFTSPNLTLSLT